MSSRASALDQLAELMRSISTYRLLLHQSAASRLELSMTELRCLDIARNVPDVTPSRMAEMVGLSASAMTAVIDRLEVRRLVQRAHDSQDRRRVLVSSTGIHETATADLFAPLVNAAAGVLAAHSPEDRAIINDFVSQLNTACANLVDQQTGALGQPA